MQGVVAGICKSAGAGQRKRKARPGCSDRDFPFSSGADYWPCWVARKIELASARA